MQKKYVAGKTERILTLYRKLNSGEVVNKAKLAEQMGVDGRTIQRDIDDLRTYFANETAALRPAPEIVFDRGEKGFRLQTGAEKMTGSQALVVGKILLESRALVKDELQPLLDKLVGNCVPENTQDKIREMLENEEFHYVEPRHQCEIVQRVWDLDLAVQKHQFVEISYTKQGELEVIKRLVKPVGILFSEFYFYMVAFIHDEETKENKYLAPAIYRIDRINSYEIQNRHFSVPYKDRFEEGEFRKRIQFMYGGELQRLIFEYSGKSVEAILDRLPTARIMSHENEKYTIKAEVFGTGIDIWLRSQGDSIKVISRKNIR